MSGSTVKKTRLPDTEGGGVLPGYHRDVRDASMPTLFSARGILS
jgi:hypothetical protein